MLICVSCSKVVTVESLKDKVCQFCGRDWKTYTREELEKLQGEYNRA